MSAFHTALSEGAAARVPGFCATLGIGLLFSFTASAATISPATFTTDLKVGESVTINKTITLDATARSKADIFFLADNTGSMGDVIAGVKANASSILNALQGSIADVAFGVGRYVGDPFEGVGATTAYQLQQAISSNAALSVTAINAWSASGGGDIPEANFFALHQVATQGVATPGTNIGTGSVTGWRSGSSRVVIWFGDAPSHTETIDQANTIAALTAQNVIVAGLNSEGAGAGIDQNGQASAVASATGGLVRNNNDPAGVAAAILAAVSTVTSSIDLVFASSASFPGGLKVSFACTDPAGCSAVPGGATRQFAVTFTGLAPGRYEFDVFANGVSAAEHDVIEVAAGTDLPEPSTSLLIGTALAGLALIGRKRA